MVLHLAPTTAASSSAVAISSANQLHLLSGVTLSDATTSSTKRAFPTTTMSSPHQHPLVSMLKRVSLSAPLQFDAMDESGGSSGSGQDTPPATDAGRMCSAASGHCSGSTSFSSISASVGFAQPLGELGAAVPDAEEEEAVRQCFCDAYEMEVQHLQQCGRPLPDVEQQQQILADLLVWAEVTQRHYDQQTQSFVVQPHMSDSGFARLGDFYKAAKAKHGLQ